MTTANEIFQTALSLIGNSDGAAHYESRALPGINLLLADLARLDRALNGEAAAPAAAVPAVTDLAAAVEAADVITRSLMPVGLAAFLLSEEEEKRSAFFQELYRTEREVLARTLVPGRRHSIREMY